MKKLTIIIVALITGVFFTASANAEICIAGRCTDANSIGSVSVTSSMTNYGSSWDCSGPGCSNFERQSDVFGSFWKPTRLDERDVPPLGEGKAYFYNVASGDTLGDIAQKTNCILDELVRLNIMINPGFEKDSLRVGQKIALMWHLSFE